MADPIIQSMLAEQAYGPIYSSQYSDAAKAARANEIARRIGMDPDLVESAMPDMMAEDRMQRVIGEARKNEAYARIMSNWRLAPAAIDDEQLPKVAQTASDVLDASKMSFLSKAQLYGSSILKSFPQASANFYRMLQMGVDSLHSIAAKGSTADEELPVLSSWLDRAARSQEEIGRVPVTTSPTLNAVASGGQSFGPSIMAGIAALMGQPEAGGALMGGLTAGQTYKQSKDQGATQGQAVSNALQQGAEETIFETLGGRLFKGFVDEGGDFLTHILPRQLLTEVATEIPTTWAQNLSQYANVDMPQGNEGFGDFLKHTFGEDTLSTIIATVAMAGPMIGGSYGVHTAFNRVVNGQIDKRANQQVDRMMNAAAQSSTRTANPSDFEEALNQLVGDTSAGTLYIPADKVQELFQTDDGGVSLADDPFWGQYEDQVNEAAAIGGDVVVPLATAATHLAGSPQWAALKEHVRTRPGGASLSELKDRPVDTEQLAADLASRMDEVIPQLHADRLTKQFAADLGYEGEQADAVSRLLAAGMIRAHALDNAKRASRGEAPVPLDDFAKDYLPQAEKTTQAEYDAGQRAPAEAAQRGDSSLNRTASWVIRNKNTGEVIMETFDPKKVEKLNTKKYEAVPIREYLGSINGKQGGEALSQTTSDGNHQPDQQHPESERKGVPPIDPAMLRKIMRGGHVLDDTFRRGNISIARDEQGLMSGAVIRAFEAADFSTAVHELGHFFIEDLKRRAVGGDATEQEQADWQAFKGWAKVEGDTIPTEAHEQWARGFERYIYEGKAPSSKLKVMFARMRDFMMSLYRSIRAFNSPITPEIREVMDRLLASDEEIAAQREEMRLVGDQLASLMSESERQAYIDLGNESREAARDQLFERVMSTLKAERDRQFAAQRRQIKDEVTTAHDELPVFKALRFMRVGLPLEDGTTQRLSLPRDWVVENYGEDMLEKLPKPVDLIVNNSHAVDPEYIASQAGFESADQMMSALVLSEQQRQFIKSGGDKRSVRQAMIDAQTEARVREELGDPYADLEDEAKAALANEKEADRLSLELRALARKAGKRPTAWQMAKEWAHGHVRSKTAKDAVSGASLQMYARNAAKAAREVEEALVADKFDEAFAAKQRQLLNMALLQQAKQAKDEVDKAVRRMQKIAGRDTIRSVDQDYLDQAHQLLEAVDLKTRPSTQTDKRLAFEEWYAKQVQNGVDPVVPPQYRALLGKTNWERLPISDLLQLDEAVNQVIELGRLKQTLKDGKKKRDFEEGVAEMQGSGEQIPPRAKGKTTDPRRSLPGRIRSVLRSVDAAMLKVEQMAAWLDNGDPNGPWSRLLFRPLADAQGHETDLLRTYTKELNALVKSLPRAQVRAWTRLVDTPELVIRNANHLNDGEAWSGTKDQVVMMAMNWGNEGNRQRLLDGFGWKEGDVLAVFDRILTKEDWDFVQGVWDTVDNLWPDIAALEREVNGVSPEKVDATAVETPHGVYRGGYFPAVYDPTQSTRAAQDEAESLAPNGAWFTVTTRASSTKARAQQVKGRPLLLSMNVITRHVGEVIHDVTHRQAVSQAKRLLTDPRIHATISNRLGPEYAKAMSAWLENVARPNSSFSKSNPTGVAIGRYLNKGVSLVGLGFRMTTSLVQLLGIPVAGKMLGSKYLGKGIAIVSAHPVQAWKEMTKRSAEMRARADTLDATIEDMIRQQSGSSAIQTIGPKGMEKYAFQGIVWMDMVTTTTVWTGAFNKALDEGMTEEDAVFYADKAVRTTQGTGGMKDRSAIQNEHPLVRSLYPFFSYMNALYNMQRDVFRQAAHARSASDLAEAARQAWWVFIVPTLLQALIFGDGPDPGDDGEVDGLDWVKYLSASIVLGNLGSLPLIGNLANAIGGGWSYRSNAYQQIGEGIKNGYEHGVKLAKGDEELKGSTVQSVLTTVGLLTAKPLGQIGATSRGLYDYATGEAEPQDAGDWYELLTKGRISDRPTAAERLTGESG